MNPNPLVPAAYDVVWMAAALAALVLAVAAVVSIARSPGLRAAARVLWLLVVVIVPVVGALAWFALAGRRVSPSEG